MLGTGKRLLGHLPKIDPKDLEIRKTRTKEYPARNADQLGSNPEALQVVKIDI